MAKTWAPNNTNRQQVIGGRLVNPGDGAFVEVGDPTTATPVQVQAQITGAGALDLLAGGATFRAPSAAVTDGMTSFFVAGAALVPDWVSAPWSVAVAASFATGACTDLGQQLVAWRDTTAYTYTSNPMLPDHEGTMQATLTGELLHYGMRRIYNELRYTEKLDFTGTMGWYQPNGLTVAPLYHAAKRPPWWVRNQSRRGGTVWKLTPGGVANSVQRWPDSGTAGVVFDAAPRVFGVHLIADTPHQAELRVYPAAGGAALATVIVNVTTEDQLFALPFTPDGVTAYNLGIAPVTFAGTSTTPVYMHSPMICKRLPKSS